MTKVGEQKQRLENRKENHLVQLRCVYVCEVSVLLMRQVEQVCNCGGWEIAKCK